jgi:CRISPR-associated protein (TIGR03986 family)
VNEHVVQVSNLPAGFTEQQFADLLTRLIPGLATGWKLEGRTAQVFCAAAEKAKQARNSLNGKMLKGVKRPIKAEVVQAAVMPARTQAGRPAATAPLADPVATSDPTPAAVDDTAPVPASGDEPFSAQSQDERESPPYHFVPVDGSVSIAAAPQYHDRSDLDRLWSGELRCTLTALTPLLAANDQYQRALDATPQRRNEPQLVARREVAAALKELVRTRLRLGPGAPDPPIDADKHILEPLALPGNGGVPGPVLISGAAIKGPLRQALGALLSAPLERVQERHFSYRPNVKLDPAHDNQLLSRAGVVSRTANGGLEVIPVQLAHITFVRDNALDPLLAAWGISRNDLKLRITAVQQNTSRTPFSDRAADLFRSALSVPGCRIQQLPGRSRLQADRHQSATLANVYLLPYRAGLDGSGAFNQAFHDDDARRGYPYVLVRIPNGTPVTIPPAVVEHWNKTLHHLGDEERGHLLRHPKIGERQARAVEGIRRLRQEGFRPGDVVYFEQRTNDYRVVTLGHHFRYRWRYRDTIHGTRIQADQATHGPALENERLRLRNILCPLSQLEQEADDSGRPKQLSGARLLFGYVGTTDGQYHPDQPLTFGIGMKKKGQGKDHSDFFQLAGRIRINTAVEQVGEKRPEKRFMSTASEEWLVPLRPLGSPKPSAVEFYLRQDRKRDDDAGLLNTYGDTADDRGAGQLNGRKFYLHQPTARDHREVYELFPPRVANPYPAKAPRGVRPEEWQQCVASWRDQDRTALCGNQAAVGRFICRPDTEFRFTLRFINLRRWELGAVLFALAPRPQDALLIAGRDLEQQLPEWIRKPPTGAPALAHKLGHGRPLGLGSVTINVHEIHRLERNPDRFLDLKGQTSERDKLIQDFADEVKRQLVSGFANWLEKVLVPWLRAHRYAGQAPHAYPRAMKRTQGGEVTYTIFNWHTNLRADHAGGRKRRRTGPRPRHGLQDL